MDNKNIKVIIATDCGSTTTKAILIEFIDGEYRLTHRGEAPTTVEAPFEDVTRGVLNSLIEGNDLHSSAKFGCYAASKKVENFGPRLTKKKYMQIKNNFL